MFDPLFIIKAILLLSLAVAITYYDVRYRRIPNAVVLTTLVCGLVISTFTGGLAGLVNGLGGFALAFGLSIFLHFLGAMGAGDVKLFAAIGSVIGVHLVLPAFGLIALIGGVIAIFTVIRARAGWTTMHGVLSLLISFLPGWKMLRSQVSQDRRLTVPYGVAITLGSLISLVVFRH